MLSTGNRRLAALGAFGTGLVVTGASGAMWMTSGWEGCWNSFKSEAAECCNIGSPAAVQACLEGELEAYAICLETAEPPGDCHHQFRDYIRECDHSPPCGGSSAVGQTVCFEAAKAFLRWCLGGSASYEELASTPLWTAHPTSIEVGETVTFTTTTNDAAVVQVRFIAHRTDASSSDPDAIFVIGNGTATSLGGDMKSWSITVDSGNWPLETSEARMLVWAEAYYQSGLERLIFDASDPASITLTRP